MKLHEVYSDDLLAKNSFEKKNVVKPTFKILSAKEVSKLNIKKHSFVFLVIDA